MSIKVIMNHTINCLPKTIIYVCVLMCIDILNEIFSSELTVLLPRANLPENLIPGMRNVLGSFSGLSKRLPRHPKLLLLPLVAPQRWKVSLTAGDPRTQKPSSGADQEAPT